MEVVVRGGYPEAIFRDNPKRRRRGHRQYLEALIQRDVRDVAHLEKIPELRKLLQAAAFYAGRICNYTRLGRDAQLDQKSTARYLDVLEQMYLLRRCPAFSGNRLKLSTWSEGEYHLFYYRDHDQREVDFLVEDSGGRVIGIEVKGAASVKKRDLKGLRFLESTLGDRLLGGFLLYDGPENLPLGGKLRAVPLSSLW